MFSVLTKMKKIRYHLLVSLGLIIVSSSVTAQSTPVNDLEKAFIPYFRSLLIEEDYKKLEEEIKSFNQWGKEAEVDLETVQKKFQKEYEELKEEEKNLKVLSDELNRSAPNLKSRYEVERYNKKVETFNKRKERFNGKVEEFKEKEKALNDNIEAYEKESLDKQKALTLKQNQLNQERDRYQNWIKSGEAVDLYRKLNRVFAKAFKSRYENPIFYDRLKRLREKVFQTSRTLQKRSPNGLILVEVWLNDKVSSYLIFDTGASMVTLPRSLVEAAGINIPEKEPIEMTLTGGIRVQGPEIIVPKIRLGNQEKEQVPAIVLDETASGIDGLLGHSFFGDLKFVIDKSNDNPVYFLPRD